MAKCTIEGCINNAGVPGSARGLCRAHYRRWQRYGTALEPIRRINTWSGEVCSVNGCDKEVKINGVCVNHYAVIRRRNDPAAAKRRSLAFKERLRAKQEIIMGRPRTDKCELCGGSGYERGNKPGTGIVFDHCHASGAARGWLCDRCNKVLGLVRDNSDLLVRMAAYLEVHNGKNQLQRPQIASKIRICGSVEKDCLEPSWEGGLSYRHEESGP